LGKISASLATFGAGVPVARQPPRRPLPPPRPPCPDGYEPVYIDTPECTACDECTKLAPKVFAYNADKKAIVINPQGASTPIWSRPRRSAPPAACTPARRGT
jgi:pyruvate-ferredoxin/flavodoxin oxidoreductase